MQRTLSVSKFVRNNSSAADGGPSRSRNHSLSLAKHEPEQTSIQSLFHETAKSEGRRENAGDSSGGSRVAANGWQIVYTLYTVKVIMLMVLILDPSP